jgi:hypothetical protein
MENQEEAGGTISFLLPPEVSVRRKTWIERRRPTIMRVLVIEDDPNIAEAVSLGLERLSLQPQLVCPHLGKGHRDGEGWSSRFWGFF